MPAAKNAAAVGSAVVGSAVVGSAAVVDKKAAAGTAENDNDKRHSI